MKLRYVPMMCCLLAPAAWADDNGGLQKGDAPPPPHALDDGYRGTDDARIMTVEHAKTMHDGATISLRGNVIKHEGDDRYLFRDKTGTIAAIIPAAVFDGQDIKPDKLVSINGSLDSKMTPPLVRVDKLRKQAPN